MKGISKIAAGVLALATALSLASCSGMTVEQRVGAGLQSVQDVKSMDMDMDIHFQMSAAGQTMNFQIASVCSIFNAPMQMKAEVSVNMGSLGSQKTVSYAQEKDGSYIQYLQLGEDWVQQSVALEDLSQYNTPENLELYLQEGMNFKEAGKETIENTKTVKVEGMLTGEVMQKAVLSSGVLDSMEGLNSVEEQQLLDLYKDLPDLPIIIWLDEKSNLPVKYEMDMTPMLNGIIQKAYKDVSGTESLNISVDKAIISVHCYNYNNATSFTIPQEALNAPLYSEEIMVS